MPRQNQPHGAVIIARQDDHRIVHVSANVEQVLEESPDELLGASLVDLVGPRNVENLAVSAETRFRLVQPGTAVLPNGHRVTTHAYAVGDGLMGIDVVPEVEEDERTAIEVLGRIGRWSDELYHTGTQPELLQLVATTVQELSGFDGVWACRIEPDGNGVVVATSITGPTESALSQSVLASDMPPTRARDGGRPSVSFVPDVTAEPVGLTPLDGAEGLDLSVSTLRLEHHEFFARMADLGVRATLSVPIIVDGDTWGLVIAHNPRELVVPLVVQAELALVGEATGRRLTGLIERDRTRDRLARSGWVSRILEAVGRSTSTREGLLADERSLLGLCDATGVVVSIDGRTDGAGTALEPGECTALLAHAREALRLPGSAPVVAYNSLIGLDVPRSRVSGYLAARLTDDAENLLVWFRPEEGRVVTWVEHHAVGDNAPENLFEEMGERVEREHGVSRAWSGAEQDAVGDLQRALGGLMLARVRQLSELNLELRRSNDEFNAFAHAAAHDLKQPIRGIRQYTEFFLEETEGSLAENDVELLHTVLRLSGRMTNLLDDLLRYAELGESEIAPEPIALAPFAAEVVELLPPTTREAARIEINDGGIVADPSGLRQVLLNLVGNACKFASGTAEVSVGVTTLERAAGEAEPPDTLVGLPPETPVLAVSDRGIGIPEDRQGDVFALFRKLGPDTEGSGAGLALCRRIARRHGGDIWVRSVLGEGSTFFVVMDVGAAPAWTR